MTSAKKYHVPVLLNESITGLNIVPDAYYVDVTFGGGGHSKLIQSKLNNKGHLIAFDRDADAINNSLTNSNFTLVNHDYRWLNNFLDFHKKLPVKGILADLGVSSHHFDAPERGFSFRFNAPLDMRMDQTTEKTAAQVLNEYSPQALQKILGLYGEIKNAKTLCDAIIAQRNQKPFDTTFSLVQTAEKCIKKKDKPSKYLSQLFQALRIEVNDELKSLELFLLQTADAIEKGGRLVVITYHSLEDRMVKNFIQTGNIEGKRETDIFGHTSSPFAAVNRKPITASNEELEINPRSRSAKLRVAERV